MSDAVLEITDENFDDETIAGNKLVMVDFFSEWSSECERVSTIVEEMAQKYVDRVKVRKVDIDRNAETAVRYDVLGAPTVIFFQQGEELGRVDGVITKAKFCEKMEQILKKVPPPPARPEPTLGPR